jgi:1-acyl-sn-glycerol-3-phosphate acyltransferase
MLLMFRSLWIWAASASLMVVWCPLLGIVRLTDRDPLHRRTARWFRRLGHALARVNPWRLHFSGWENLKPGATYVIVSNHQSLADIPLISHLPVDAKWLAKTELFHLPLVGWMLRMADDIAVDRGNRRKGAQALLQASRVLRQHCSLMFFPEGTRTTDGEIKAFTEAPFQLAIRERVPVLPLVVEGSGSALPKHTWMFGGIQDIYLTVLPPVAPDAPGSAALRDMVRSLMIGELARMRSRG